MTRSEMVDAIHNELGPKVPKTDIRRAVDAVFEEIADSLTRGGRVELRGFGAFSVKTYAPYTGRNPRTGEAVHVPEKRYPSFRAGKGIRDRLNGRDTN